MTNTPDKDEDRVLAGEYAIGLLTPDEAAAFAARLAVEPDLRRLVRQWTEDFACLAEDIEPETPPAWVQAGVDSRLFSGPARGPLGVFRRVVVPLMTAASLVVALFLVSDPGAPGVVSDPGAPGVQPPAPPVYQADLEAEDSSLVFSAGYDATTRQMYVERRQGAARPGRVLELWLIADDNPPVSLGVLPDNARVRLPVPEALRDRLEGGILALSDEPPGGSPTGAPTGAVLAVGPLMDV